MGYQDGFFDNAERAIAVIADATDRASFLVELAKAAATVRLAMALEEVARRKTWPIDLNPKP